MDRYEDLMARRYEVRSAMRAFCRASQYRYGIEAEDGSYYVVCLFQKLIEPVNRVAMWSHQRRIMCAQSGIEGRGNVGHVRITLVVIRAWQQDK